MKPSRGHNAGGGREGCRQRAGAYHALSSAHRRLPRDARGRRPNFRSEHSLFEAVDGVLPNSRRNGPHALPSTRRVQGEAVIRQVSRKRSAAAAALLNHPNAADLGLRRTGSNRLQRPSRELPPDRPRTFLSHTPVQKLTGNPLRDFRNTTTRRSLHHRSARRKSWDGPVDRCGRSDHSGRPLCVRMDVAMETSLRDWLTAVNTGCCGRFG
jgi:hypothetical protein